MGLSAGFLDKAIVDSIASNVLLSPADSDVLDTPTPSSAAAALTPSPAFLSDTLPSPAHIPGQSVTTPVTEASTHPNMNLIVGGALAPVPHLDTSPRPTEPLRSRAGSRLKLPSFEALGIASPHPDRFGVLGDAISMKESEKISNLPAQLGSMTLSSPLIQQGGQPFAIPGSAKATPFRHDVAVLTPPAESGDIVWNPVIAVSSPAMDSPATDPGSMGSITPQDASRSGSVSASTIIAQPNSANEHTWIEGALRVLLENLRSASLPTNPLRVLSHALPSPSTTGHVFPLIIDSIHGSTPAQPTIWINVFHAIQGRFNLADLPTSPPSTPGPAIGGDDYFTQKVFDTAVPISDYQQDLSSLPRSPRPIVPPSSINVSIVERYIPPSTTHEFEQMFSHTGPSILVDRLVELSPNNGTLVFIYPTRAGGGTFMRDYLGPLLDPQLRSLVVLNGLSSNLSRSLGRMSAIDSLLTYEQMHRSMASLCAKLTQRSSTIERFHGRRAAFSLVYASRQEVHPDRQAWSRDWWAKQEKQRIRDMMTKYAQEAQKMSSNEHSERSPTPTELIQQLLDGVTRKSSYPPGQEPTGGIEVSVFVIKRSD